MALERTPWRRRSVSLTPLIDIIFLLLLFFMLGSTFTRFAEVPLMNAGDGAADGAAPLFLQLRPDDIVLNGEAMALDAVRPALADLSGEHGTTLLVTVSHAVTAQRLVDLLAELRGAPGLAVSVLE